MSLVLSVPDVLISECEELAQKLNAVIEKIRDHNEDVTVIVVNSRIIINHNTKHPRLANRLWF